MTAVVLWLLFTLLFSLYVNHLASYSKTYGTLGCPGRRRYATPCKRHEGQVERRRKEEEPVADIRGDQLLQRDRDGLVQPALPSAAHASAAPSGWQALTPCWRWRDSRSRITVSPVDPLVTLHVPARGLGRRAAGQPVCRAVTLGEVAATAGARARGPTRGYWTGWEDGGAPIGAMAGPAGLGLPSAASPGCQGAGRAGSVRGPTVMGSIRGGSSPLKARTIARWRRLPVGLCRVVAAYNADHGVSFANAIAEQVPTSGWRVPGGTRAAGGPIGSRGCAPAPGSREHLRRWAAWHTHPSRPRPAPTYSKSSPPASCRPPCASPHLDQLSPCGRVQAGALNSASRFRPMSRPVSPSTNHKQATTAQ